MGKEEEILGVCCGEGWVSILKFIVSISKRSVELKG